jgi:hypothetical protein
LQHVRSSGVSTESESWETLSPGAGEVPEHLRVLADPQAKPDALAQALAGLSLALLDAKGPTLAAPRAIPLLVERLAASPARDGAALVSLLSRIALGDHPWPAPAADAAYVLARHHVTEQATQLVSALGAGDARTRHLLAHLLAWLAPSAELDAALRTCLTLEKYEAVRASLLLALATRGRAASSSADAALFRAQLKPGTPVRVTAAAAVGLCFLDPAARHEPAIARALDEASHADILSSTELAWNRGDLRALAEQALRGQLSPAPAPPTP